MVLNRYQDRASIGIRERLWEGASDSRALNQHFLPGVVERTPRSLTGLFHTGPQERVSQAGRAAIAPQVALPAATAP